MGKIDVMVVATVYGSFQCDEKELEKELAEVQHEFKDSEDLLGTIGDVEVELVGVADIHPETGDLTQRVIIPFFPAKTSRN